MFTISCFADEISNDFKEQIDFMLSHNIKYLSLRNVFGKNVLELSDEELDEVAKVLSENGLGVSSIGSPIGKSNITSPAQEVYDQVKRAINAAKKLNSKYIRVFSFYMQEEQLEKYRDEVIARLREITNMCMKEDVVAICENEHGIYGQKSVNVLDLLKSVDSPYFRTAFDPSNYVVAGEKPFEESFPRLEEYIQYVHIKDSQHGKSITLCGEGDGQIKEVLNALRDRDLFVTLEPHLMFAGVKKGFSGPELFDKDYKALTKILDDLNISYK